jgi:hypothetical protein
VVVVLDGKLDRSLVVADEGGRGRGNGKQLEGGSEVSRRAAIAEIELMLFLSTG